MEKVNATKVMAATLMVLLLAMLLAAACAKPALAPPAAPVPTPAPKSAPPPAPAPALKANPLAAIIEGAKKEGAVSVVLSSRVGRTDTLKALEKAIAEKYGVELRITWTASGGMAARVAAAVMETKTGAVPSFDLLRLSTVYIPAGMKEGAFERVDWRPLLGENARADMILQHPDLRGSIVSESTMNGLMYNPQKVPAAAVPKKLADLADPKWKGKFGLVNYTGDYAKWAFILGKDKVFATLRALVNNKAAIGEAPGVNNRYLLGEIDLAFGPDTYMLVNRQKGMPTGWQSLDFVDLKEFPMVVQTRAPHPNAARLVAVYLASPDGMKFIVEQADGGSHFIPGNYVYDSVMQGKKEGIPAYGTTEYPGLLEFILSPQSGQWMKEMELILKGA